MPSTRPGGGGSATCSNSPNAFGHLCERRCRTRKPGCGASKTKLTQTPSSSDAITPGCSIPKERSAYSCNNSCACNSSRSQAQEKFFCGAKSIASRQCLCLALTCALYFWVGCFCRIVPIHCCLCATFQDTRRGRVRDDLAPALNPPVGSQPVTRSALLRVPSVGMEPTCP